MAADISNVRVKPADAENETESLLTFCLFDRDDIEVVCTSDAAAMVAARVLNMALGMPQCRAMTWPSGCLLRGDQFSAPNVADGSSAGPRRTVLNDR